MRVARILKLAPLVLLSPLMLLVSVACLAIEDTLWALTGRKQRRADAKPSTSAASVVIPNWNGRDLLEKYLPSVVAATEGNPANVSNPTILSFASVNG